MVCGSALSELLVGHGVTHPPTPHFPYCTADRVQLKLAVGVILKVRFGVKTYVHYLQVMGFSFVQTYKCICLLSCGCFTFCQPPSSETGAEGQRVCVSNEAKQGCSSRMQ